MTVMGPRHFIPEPDVGAAVRHLFRVGAVLVGVGELGLAVRRGIHGDVRDGIRSIDSVGSVGGLGGDGNGCEDRCELHLGGLALSVEYPVWLLRLFLEYCREQGLTMKQIYDNQ